MPTTPLFPLPEGLEITAVSRIDEGLLVRVISNRVSCPCPVCGTPSEAVHSFYRRHPLELPCAGQRVQLLLIVHTFFCRAATCSRKLFTELLPELLQPNSRLTTRLRSLIQAIGLAFNGQGGARLSKQYGIQISRGSAENATVRSSLTSKAMRSSIFCQIAKPKTCKSG